MNRIGQLNQQVKEMTRLLGVQGQNDHENRDVILVAINDIKDELIGLYINKINEYGIREMKSCSDPRPNPIPTTESKCLCGAKHTSNPGWHMNFCPMKEDV